MSPGVKYTLGRLGLFLAVALVLWPVPLNLFVKLMLAVIISAALAFFLLRGLRDQMAEQLSDSVTRRRTEKEKLRSALAGDDQAAGSTSATGDASTDDAAAGKRSPDADR
ncbi:MULTISPECIES: DUF4229 domain-containing protein [Polymorphospora]|uniref:DUF4229 domain-containing protein n=1 Tax=Polymorphospora lycopeni TaxID=3140240 RepID=A0ABV5CMZ4_9ACTN